MTATPPPFPTAPPPPPPPRPPAGSAFFDSLRRSGLFRGNDRWIGGVAAGIARRTGVDPLLIRGLLIVLTLFGGLALLLYGVAWALLPEEDDGRIHLQEAFRGRFDAALAGAAAFVVVGLSRPSFWFDPDRWVPGWLVTMAWLGLIATVVVAGVLAASGRKDRPPVPGGPARPGTAPPPWNGGAPMSSPQPTPPSPTPYPAWSQHDPAQHPAHQAAQHTQAAPYVPAAAGAPAPAWQPPPPRPPVPGPGSTTVAVTLALVLLTGAAVLLGHRAGLLGGNVLLTLAGASVVLLGLAALVSGLRGRRAGALAGLAVVVAVLAAPVAAVTTVVPQWSADRFTRGFVAGEVAWAPGTVAEAQEGLSFALGEARVDLTGPAWVPATSGQPPIVRIEAGAGTTTVLVPTGVALEVRATVQAGEVHSLLAPGWTGSAEAREGTVAPDLAPGPAEGYVSRVEAEGTSLAVDLRSPVEGPLALVVEVGTGLGEIVIEEEAP